MDTASRLPLSRPSRRDALIGLAASLPLPALAQTGASAPPRIAMRAEAVERRLGGEDKPASRLFRLRPAGLTPERPDTFSVFRARESEACEIEIENALGHPLAFHFRGLRSTLTPDGVPDLSGRTIAPGEKAVVPLDTRQPGTFLMAPVIAAQVCEQNARGLHAAVIVEEREPPVFDLDHVLAVGDWRLDGEGRLQEDFGTRMDIARVGRLGNRLVANRSHAPERLEARPGARLRIRMINTSNARPIPLKVSGCEAKVYSIDSTPCQPFDPLRRTVTLSPGTRIELAIDLPAEPDKEARIEAKLGDGLPMLVIRTKGEPIPRRGDIAPLPDPGLPPAIKLQNAARADIRITGGIGTDPAEATPEALAARFPDPARIFSVNGGTDGFAGKPVLKVKRGREVVFAVFNDSAWPQVLAVHGHAFRLLHPFDDGWEPYFLDTLYLAPKTVARIAFIADNPGRWALRSAVAEHFAGGVRTWFEVE